MAPPSAGLVLSRLILFKKCLQVAICTSTEMMVASRAVAMAVKKMARRVDVEQERQALHLVWSRGIVLLFSLASASSCPAAIYNQ